MDMPGPTGESNQLSTYAKQRVLCLGSTVEDAVSQTKIARTLGCNAVAIAPGLSDGLDGTVSETSLSEIHDLDAVISWSDNATSIRNALANRPGPIVPLLTMQDFEQWLTVERHVCIDTTAAGGNVTLMAATETPERVDGLSRDL